MRELKRLNQLKDDFLSTVSHELRTPVTNMKMAIQMLSIALMQTPRQCSSAEADGSLNCSSKIAYYFQILRDECERESSLINDLLDLQRLDADHQPLTLQKICIQDWLPQIAAPFLNEPKSSANSTD